MKIILFFYEKMPDYENYRLLEVVRETKTLWITAKDRIRKDGDFIIYEPEKHLEKIKRIRDRKMQYKVLDNLQELLAKVKYEALRGNKTENFQAVLELCQNIVKDDTREEFKKEDMECMARRYRDIIRIEHVKSTLMDSLEALTELYKTEDKQDLGLLMLEILSKCREVKGLLKVSLKTEEEILEEVKEYDSNMKGI